MAEDGVRAAAGAYLVAQGVAVPVWWAGLTASPGFRARFELGERVLLDSFAPSDAVLAALSLTAGALVLRGHRAGALVTALTCGVVVGSTAATAGLVLRGGRGGLGALAMGAAAVGSAAALAAAGTGPR